MPVTATINPINSLIFISDARGGETPEWKQGRLILSTPSCISVGCFPEQDGPTTLTLGDARTVGKSAAPIFDDMLDTPTQTVAISTVTNETVLAANVQGLETRIRIWVNDLRWPSEIVVATG